MMRKLILTYCLLLLALVVRGQNSIATIRISQTEFTAEMGQYRFTRPRVGVYEGRQDVTSQFYLNYYIKGQEDSTFTVDNKVQTRNPVTGTMVSQLYGLVKIGSRPGNDTIRVVARPRSDSQYDACEAEYVIHIPKIEPYVVLSQDSVHVHTRQLFGFPTAKLYRVSAAGDTTDITSYYNVTYAHSSSITEYSNSLVGTMLHAPSTVMNGLILSMTYSPKDEYSGSYSSYTKSYNVTMYERAANDTMQVHMEWPNGNYITARNSTTVQLPMPLVRDEYDNDISYLFTYNFKYEGNMADYHKVVNSMWSGNNNFYGSWYLLFGYQVNDSLTLKLTLGDLVYNNGQKNVLYRDADPVVYSTNVTDSVIIQGRRRQWTFDIVPSEINIYEGYKKLNKTNWKLPDFVVRNPEGVITTGAYYRYMGIPVGVTVTGNANTQATTDTITYRGERYVLWHAETYCFTQDSWASWEIDFTNYTPKPGAPWLMFRIDIYTGGTDEPIHDYGDFRVIEHKKIATALSLSEYRLSGNISRARHQLMGFTEPTATVRDVNNINVNDQFTLHYNIADSSTVKNDFTIDSSTGKITYTGSGETNGMLYVVVTATAQDTGRYVSPTPAVYAVNIKTTDFSYEVITDQMAAASHADSLSLGKLHFTGTGCMAAGTVLNVMAGLSVQFGEQGDDDWQLIKSGSQDKEGTTVGDSLVWTEGAPVELDDNEIPVSGTFAILRPSVNGFLTIDGEWVKNNHYRLIQVVNDSIVHTVDYIRTDSNHFGDQWMNEPLMAGQTYYMYNFGADDGTNEPSHLHGFNFDPAFVNSADDHLPIEYSTTFVNGYTGTVASMVNEPTNGVSFAMVPVEGTKSGITLTDYMTIDSSTGTVTPKKRTTGITESSAKIKDRIIERGTVKNPQATVTKTANLYIFVSDIPSYIIRNGETPSAGEQVSTNNIPTKITMTFGGWQNGSGPYVYKGKALFDSWRSAKTDTVGQDNMTIDGFIYASQGSNDPRDEDYNSFNGTRSSHTPWELPCRGTYLVFEPEENGTLILYLLQNGVIDYTGGKDINDLREGYTMKYRPLYILDEAASPVPLDNTWAMDASLLPSNSRQATQAGSYTEGIYRCTWNDDWVKDNLKGIYSSSDNPEGYTDCPYDLRTNYRNRTSELDSIMTQWKKYASYSDTEHARQEIIHLASGGYTLISKAFVRYTFQVKAGKSYYIFQRGSKLSPCGFAFVPTGFPNNVETVSYSTSLDDDDNFDSKFQSVPSGYKINDELRNINVKVNRKFGRNKWTGICLPFSMSQTKFKAFFGNDASVITYDSVTADSTGYFTQHVSHSIVANRPYFICPSKDVAFGDTIYNVSIESNYGPMALADRKNMYAAVSTLAPETAPSGSYIFAGSSIYHLKTERRLSAYRAYIRPLSSSALPMKRLSTTSVVPADAPTTGILSIPEYGNNENHRLAVPLRGVYNLKGQKLGDDINNLPPGVYIVNGQKRIIK